MAAKHTYKHFQKKSQLKAKHIISSNGKQFKARAKAR